MLKLITALKIQLIFTNLIKVFEIFFLNLVWEILGKN